MTVRVDGLAGVLDTLKRLPPEIVSKAGGPVKLSLKEAAEMLRDEAKGNVRRIIDTPNIDREASDSTGLLLLSIQAKRSRVARGKNGEAYVVGIRRKQLYPASRQGQKGGITAVQVGRLLEYGTEYMVAKPWLRAAFDAKGGAALNLFVKRLTERTQKVIKKLEREARKK